jgi:hypothetical protein
VYAKLAVFRASPRSPATPKHTVSIFASVIVTRVRIEKQLNVEEWKIANN